MGLKTAVLILLLALMAALAALNWSLVLTPTQIWIGFMHVNAPFGLVMLGLTALLTVFFIGYLVYLQSSILLETRRHTKEMQAQRELADKAEASRFTELRNFLETRESAQSTSQTERHAALMARVEQLDATLRARADQTDNTLAAHLGQLEDRITRG